MKSTCPAVEICGVTTRFGKALIHDQLDLVVPQGEILGLVGGSGSGKTTLLREIVGLIAPNAGDVRLFGSSLVHASVVERQALRRRFGMLFQHGALFSALPVFDNIAFPLRELKILEEDLIAEVVQLKLAMVGLSAAHASLMPAELSGGMVKRVALARALALEPELLLLDEPTAGLDPDLSEAFVDLIKSLQRELGFTVVMVTHDLDTLVGLATQVAVLADQRVVACGPLQEVMAVEHDFIRRFFGSLRARRVLERTK